MKKLLWKSALVIGSSFMVLSGVASAYPSPTSPTITGIRSLNNAEKGIDYKVPADYLDKTSLKMVDQSDSQELIKDGPERRLSGITVAERDVAGNNENVFSAGNFKKLTTSLSDRELNWLIENNIVSREGKLSITPKGTAVTNIPVLYDRNTPNSDMVKSDFLMGVYKSLYGVIESRPLLFNIDSWREASRVYWKKQKSGGYTKLYESKRRQVVSRTGSEYKYLPFGTTQEVERQFKEGDYYYYVNPNVYELYLKEMVDKKIISLDDIKDLKFKESYSSIQESADNGSKNFPLWYNDLPPYLATSSGTSQPTDLLNFVQSSSVLGKSFNVSGGTGVTIEKQLPNYFTTEAVSAMDALKYVESMMRLTEKDMTDTEAQIVTYKYGANYLDGLVDADRKTVMFLTAKGILNFEDSTEYRNLYGNLTKEFAYKLLYRLSNKDARTKFSEIQLTDSDNFWLQKGFSQLDLTFNKEDGAETEQLKNQDGSYNVSPIPEVEVTELENTTQVKVASVAAEETTWFGLPVHKSHTNLAAGTGSFKITMVFDDYRKYRYKGINLKDKTFSKSKFPEIESAKQVKGNQWQVIFNVNASNSASAISTVSSNLQIATDSLFSKKDITAVTKYSENGVETTLVPASAFKDISSDITIVEDKLLKNKKTGAMAVLLPDKNIALVGNHVIQSDNIMVTAMDNTVYYNLDMVKMLMSNAYISTLDPNSVYLTKNIYAEKLVDVQGSTGNDIGSTYVANFKGKWQGGGDAGSPTPTINSNFVDLSQMTNSSNTLIRTFTKKGADGKTTNIKFTMIVQFMYMLPNKDDDFTSLVYDTDNPSLAQVNKFMYSKPSDKQLADWWENNIGLSNALANVIYGTSEIQYVKSGYLVPNITILYDDEAVTKNAYIGEVLKQVGAQLPASWVTKFMGNNQSYNKIQPVGFEDTDNSDSKYYPNIGKTGGNVYPLWTYAMFNNNAGAGKSILWRSMMVDRVISSEKGTVDPAQGASFYLADTGAYVVTRSDTVYQMIDSTNAKFPVDYDRDKKLIKLQTRTDESQRDYWERSYVTLDGNKFYVSGINGNIANLVDSAIITGIPTVSTKSGKVWYEVKGVTTFTTGKKSAVSPNAIQTRYETLRKSFAPATKSSQGYDKAMPVFATASGLTGKLPTTSMSKGIYYIDTAGKSGYSAVSKPFKDYNNKAYVKALNLSEAQAKTISAHVQVKVDLNYWYITDRGELVARHSSPYLQVGNVYYSGLNQSIIDSIVSKELKTTSPNKIEDGSKLIVGDFKFTKRGDYFVSDPQTNMKSWESVLAKATDSKVVATSVLKSFLGMLVRVGASDVPLAAFVKDPMLGQPVENVALDKTLIGSDAGSKSAFVASSQKNGTYTKSAYNSSHVPTIKSLVFQVKLADSLLVRQIDPETKTYELLMATNSLSEGYLDDAPFFGESLSLGAKDDMYLLMNKSSFSPLTKAAELKDNYTKAMNKAFQGDLKSMFLLFIAYIIGYLVIMSWICFVVTNYGVGLTLLETLRTPSVGRDKSGIDVLKVLSFGMFTLDTKIPLAKLVVGNLLMFIGIYVVLDVLLQNMV